jgi:beta-galactosidase GanA
VRRTSHGDPASIVPWDSVDQIGFDPEKIQGYDFLDFLQERHGDLETLNETWFGDDESRYYDSWEAVFPPIPTESGGATNTGDLGAVPESWTNAQETVKPVAADVPGWVDWMEMAGYFISDSHSEFRQDLVDNGVTEPLITTNAVMGHYINDFGWNAADTGCYPWISMDGLDAHGLDFYTIAYMQAYIASLRDADVNRDQPDRPVYVHETRWAGDRNKEGPHIAMYTFAHGADGTVFFDHARDFNPRETLGVAKAMDAMAEETLQFESEPVTDGVAALYSLDSMWVADGLTGSGRPYMVHFQSAVTTLDRMQVLYNVYADRQLEPSVPDDVSVLLAPGVRAMTDEALSSVRSLVEDGGTLITTPDFAARTRYGRERPDGDREWFQGHDDVVLLQGEDLETWLENWQRGNYQMQRGLGWADKELPAVAETIEPIVEEQAPRSVRYLDSDGNMDARKTGARRADDGTTFVFVDPWAEDVTLAVPGEFSGAQNLYRDEDVSLEMVDGEGRVTLESGPAIVRFEP